MTKNDIAWTKLFEKYDVLNEIEKNGIFKISANAIREFREPRLMAKFDHHIQLPKLFSEHKLSILPVSRGEYAISHFDAYHVFESQESKIERVAFPSFLESLSPEFITSEAVALNFAHASGIFCDFLGEQELYPTIYGRMGTGKFSFHINSCKEKNLGYEIAVDSSQLEIDAAYEGADCFAVFEAKNELAPDFLVRQLYYPFRLWNDRLNKVVRPVFLIYSNGIFRLFEYEFPDAYNYSSIRLLKQKNYSFEDTIITESEIWRLLERAEIVREPEMPFPQADSFKRVIDLCSLARNGGLSKSFITEHYAFDARQTDYYSNAAIYLNLLEKVRKHDETWYYLTDIGRETINLGYKDRQLRLCKQILEHKVFQQAVRCWFSKGEIPTKQELVEIMKTCELYNVSSESTFFRRASTIRGWLEWMSSLIQ